ncbi:DUF3558 family protein [Gordonia sp. NPDC003429]
MAILAGSLTASGTGCSIEGTPVVQHARTLPGATQAAIRQTDDSGRHLPFDTAFPDRWNTGNDGTTYEPCTAATDSILNSADLDPSTARDAAAANNQTIRGCEWRYIGNNSGLLSQYVANAQALSEYKPRQSGIIEWFPDESVAGRQVAVGTLGGSDECTAIVVSGRAHVATSVTIPFSPPPLADICAKAVDFTRATIDLAGPR